MNEVLHILNGDCTAHLLEKSSIQGEIIVWREMLCEGPLCKDVGSDDFWKIRYAFFENEVGVSKLDYFDKTIKELVKLEDLSGFKEVYLWFDYDLFCQINLLGLCTYLLKSFRKDIVYKLICTDNKKKKPPFHSIVNNSSMSVEMLLGNSIKLTRNNLVFAEQCWNLYVENDVDVLKSFDFDSCPKFNYLQVAINQHLQRFPGVNGLNQIENKIMEIINSGVATYKEIIEILLVWQQNETVYGFGDLQFELKLKKLEKYYVITENSINLSSKGRDIFI